MHPDGGRHPRRRPGEAPGPPVVDRRRDLADRRNPVPFLRVRPMLVNRVRAIPVTASVHSPSPSPRCSAGVPASRRGTALAGTSLLGGQTTPFGNRAWTPPQNTAVLCVRVTVHLPAQAVNERNVSERVICREGALHARRSESTLSHTG